MDVSIIIVNYLTSKLVFQVVDSIIEKSHGFTYEIIIVDNSNDENEFSLLNTKLSDVALIINPKNNLGFGRANNLGATFAKGKYLFFLNSDTLLMNNAINELFVFLENHPDVGISGSNLYTEDFRPNHSFSKKEKSVHRDAKQLSLFNNLILKIRQKRNDFNYSNYPVEIQGYVCGASLMIRLRDFNQIGGFDNRIFMYAEEALLCHQIIHKLGLKIYNIPSSKIVHYEGSSFSKKTTCHKAKLYIDGNVLYYQILYGFKQALRYLKVVKRAYKRNRAFFSLLHSESREYFRVHELACSEAMQNLLVDREKD